MPRDRLPVLEAGGADFADGNVEPLGDLPGEELGAHVALFDPEEQVIAQARRLVGGDFLDFEVVELDFDAAAGAGQIGGQKRGGRCGHADPLMTLPRTG